MTCMEAQSLITRFINDELEIVELEEFIKHIESCSECREELEVYYALLTAMKQLDEDKNLSQDFSQELQEKIV
ncbi:MAG TPA: zf-HC2 domain-containing protein [Mobilitalea sp.]|nr:zf-HC2 domain-containing protein [Mobilitalea sp.]